MQKIILEKETKIKLLNAIAAGELDLDNFPEITENFPMVNYISAETLTDEQLNKVIEATTSKKYYE